MPIGIPGWPDFAFSTASIASARMAFAISACETPRLGAIRDRAVIVSCTRALAFHQLQDERRQDELHREVELVPWITMEFGRDMKLSWIIDSK